MMNQTPSTPDPWHSGATPQIKQEVEDAQGNLQQQAAVGNDNNQAQNANAEDGQLDDRDVHDGVFTPIPVVGQQAAAGNYNNQNQSTVAVNVFNYVLDKDFNPFDKDVSKSEKNDTLPDPTKPLPQKPNNLPEVRLDELPDYCKKLYEDSLIIVTCPDSSAALSVAYSLTEHVPISSKRLFTGEWLTLKKLTIEKNVNIILNPEIGESKPTLIVIDTYEMQTFLDSLVVKSSTATLIKEELRNYQVYCICLAESQALRKTLERKNIKLSFPHWEVSFAQEEVSRKEQDTKGRLIASEDIWKLV